MSELEDRYPRTLDCGGVEIELTVLKELDETTVKTFADKLDEQDLLFLNRDIREPKVIEAWSRSLQAGDMVTIAATREGELIGTTAVVLDRMSWSAHVGELRILVSPEAREIGLGRELIQESFLIGLDLGLEKLTVRMTLDQERAMTVFEEMGFRTEALLRDQVKDKAGNKFDLIIMGHDVQGVQSIMNAYGLDEALS